MDVLVQARLQHAAATDVVTASPAVTVTVVSHWYCCSLHGELHVEPMGQQAAWVVAEGLTIQLSGLWLASWM